MAPGFVLDTWRVWEDLLTVALRLSWGSGKVNVQRSVALGTRMVLGADGKAHSRTAWVTPDLDLSCGGDGVLIDSKYKGRIGESKNRVSEADLYEALAFASASKRKRVILLYPAVARTPSPQPVGTTTIFERIVVGDTAVFAGEVEVRGISKAGGLRRFADTIGKAMTFLAEAESPRQ
ncbi:MAG: hypothetical protein BroJett014_04460 [Planctomycetota bacterium]|nr:MAG: hypothetical protein BroJett014_04460 [Planctomycetota bacterium]